MKTLPFMLIYHYAKYYLQNYFEREPYDSVRCHCQQMPKSSRPATASSPPYAAPPAPIQASDQVLSSNSLTLA